MGSPCCFRPSLPLALILTGQICMAKILGPDLYLFVRDLHIDERAMHSYVLHPQVGALQGERAARVLGRPRVRIYTFKVKSIALIPHWFPFAAVPYQNTKGPTGAVRDLLPSFQTRTMPHSHPHPHRRPLSFVQAGRPRVGRRVIYKFIRNPRPLKPNKVNGVRRTSTSVMLVLSVAGLASASLY